MTRIRILGPRLGTARTQVRPMPKQTDPHYQSPEHKAWAAEVFKRAGGRCQAPGCPKFSPEHRMFADHIVERQDGGADLDPANGQLLCGAHHSAKTARARALRAGRG